MGESCPLIVILFNPVVNKTQISNIKVKFCLIVLNFERQQTMSEKVAEIIGYQIA